MSYLELSHVQKAFSNAVAVEDFNLVAEPGEFVSFLGPSGCGKTTTLRMVAGFELPTKGKITLEGQDLTYVPPNRRNVGMVFQSYALFPTMTVAENISFGLRMVRRPKAEASQRVNEMLALIHMEDFGGRYPGQLSGGQQQRVALARALAIHPRILLLDEPLSALDAKIRVELRQEIRRIQQELGITTIYVTHDQEEALSLSDRVVVMSQGHIEQIGTPFEIYNYPTTEFVASFVGQINLIPVKLINPADRLVSVGGQTIQAGRMAEKFSLDRPRLAIRPEELNPGHAEGVNNLRGIVHSITYLGSIVRIRVGIDEVPISIDMFNDREFRLPEVGQHYDLHFPINACWLL